MEPRQETPAERAQAKFRAYQKFKRFKAQKDQVRQVRQPEPVIPVDVPGTDLQPLRTMGRVNVPEPEAPQQTSRPADLGRNVAAGAVETTANVVQNIPTVLAALGRAVPQSPGAPPSYDAQRDPGSDLDRRIAELRGSIQKSLDNEGSAAALAEKIRQYVPETDPARADQFITQTARALGSMGPFLLSGVVGPLGVAAAGSAAGAGETIDEARAAGVTDASEIDAAVGMGAMAGLSEIVPVERALSRLTKLVGPSAGEILSGIAEEFGQEVFQRFVQNVAASESFDPERGLMEGVGEAGATGGTVGGIVNALAVAAGIPLRRARNVQTDTGAERGPAETQEPGATETQSVGQPDVLPGGDNAPVQPIPTGSDSAVELNVEPRMSAKMRSEFEVEMTQHSVTDLTRVLNSGQLTTEQSALIKHEIAKRQNAGQQQDQPQGMDGVPSDASGASDTGGAGPTVPGPDAPIGSAPVGSGTAQNDGEGRQGEVGPERAGVEVVAQYKPGEKYHQIIPEISSIDPQALLPMDSGEVSSVSDDVAQGMDFSEPVEVSVFADGEIRISDGHHRVAAAKQLGMSSIPVVVQAINAKGERINDLIAKQKNTGSANAPNTDSKETDSGLPGSTAVQTEGQGSPIKGAGSDPAGRIVATPDRSPIPEQTRDQRSETPGDQESSQDADRGELIDPVEAAQRAARESNDPDELISIVVQEQGVNTAQEAVNNDPIADFFDGGGRVSTSSYDDFADPHIRKDGRLHLRYTAKNGKALDDLAQELSGYGREVVPQDIVEFMHAYPKGIRQYRSSFTSQMEADARDRYKEVTGKNLTPKKIDDYLKRSAPEFYGPDGNILDEVQGLVDQFATPDGLNYSALSEYLNTEEGKGWFTGFPGNLTDEQYQRLKDEVDKESARQSRQGEGDSSTEAPDRQGESGSDEEVADQYGSGNKIVSRERYDQIQAELKERLGRSNTISPTDLALAAELATFHIEAGARRFADFSSRMVQDLGEKIRPHLKDLHKQATDAIGMTESKAFKRWFGDSKVVDADGKPLVVYHGASRSDRIGDRFRRDRATSGPMAFFTDSPDLASSYAASKSDTSNEVLSYAEWFMWGGEEGVPIDQAWMRLTARERASVRELYRRVSNVDENWEEVDSPVILPEGETAVASDSHWDYVMKREAGGNPLKAMVNVWLESGHLFGDEEVFMDLLKLAGVDTGKVEYNSPDIERQGVFPVYLSIQNPLDTSKISDNLYNGLIERSEETPKPTDLPGGMDQWDKRGQDPSVFRSRLESDREKGTTFAWTSIPDWVTEYLIEQGYDGIQDVSGKGGGEQHTVWVPFNESQVKSATGNKGTFDPESPIITQGIDTTEITDTAKKYLKRYFTSKGDLPEDAFRAKIKRDGLAKSIEREVKYTIGDFERALKAEYGKSVPPEAIRLMDEVLKGNADPSALPESLAPIVQKMRKQIDMLSDAMIRSGAATGDLALTVDANKGTYVTRTYKVFEDPKWAENVPEEVKNKAIAFIRAENPNLSESEVEGLVESLLHREQDSPWAAFAGKKLGSKDLSITKRRKDIAPEIRALMGEIRDPRTNYSRSMLRMAQVVANQSLLNEVREKGIGVYLFEKPIVKDGVSYTTQIAADGSKTMAPLNGLYTSEEVKNAFETIDANPQHGKALQSYMTALSMVKAAKTIGSVQTQVRNYLGNILFAVANGHWDVRQQGKALAAVKRNIQNKGSKDQRNEWKKLVRLGVIDESVGANEIEAMFEDASIALDSPDAYTENIAKRAAKGTARFATKLYRTSDDAWKIHGFYNERARYRKALPDATDAEIDQMAADIIRNAYPTYSLVPEGVKMLRRSPVVGSFVSFAAEIPRLIFHAVRQTKVELSTPALRKIGMQRAAGIIAAATLPAAASAFSRALMGMTRDDDEAVRRFVPPWEEYSDLFYYATTPEGNLKYADIGYLNPYSYALEPINALLSNLDETTPGNAAAEAIRVAFEPFLSEEILTQTVLDISRNKKESGAPVYNDEAPPEEQISDIMAHVWKAFEPGTISSLRRIADGLQGQTNVYGTARDPKTETIALFTGMRHKELDPKQALSYRAREFSARKNQATRIFTSVLSKRGRVSEDEIRNAHEAMEQSRRELWDAVALDVEAATRLGLTEREARAILDDSGLSATDARDLVTGRYAPYSNASPLRSRIEAAKGSEREELIRRAKIARDLIQSARTSSRQERPQE